MSECTPLLQALVGKVVVLDVTASYVYVGTLREFDHRYLVLTDADAHDLRDTTTTRDLYVLAARRHGVNVNRRRVLVSRDQVVSLSNLNDVTE
jgi:small nuclear ribonucleoprotein (snRNP)-like protein